MIRRPPRSTLFPTRRSSDLARAFGGDHLRRTALDVQRRALVEVRLLLARVLDEERPVEPVDRKSTRLSSSHPSISYAVFCLKKKKKQKKTTHVQHWTTNAPN